MMIKADLITGFLGSGKTTFIKKYADYLIRQGNRIGILENDFGAVNIDMMLLQELQGEKCDLEMITGSCDKDCHKRRFKTKLISMGMCGYDRVLIEPSGIFDTDEFFDILREEPLDKWYEIGNVISVVDAGLEDCLSNQSEYILASQTANAGIIILSRVQETPKNDIDKTIVHINTALNQFHCNRHLKDEIIIKDWNTLSESDFAEIAECGYVPSDYVKLFSSEHGYTSLYYMNVSVSAENMKQIAEKILNDTQCGTVFRVKGFIFDNNQWFELNATHKNIHLQPAVNGQEIIIVIGENLNKDNINAYFK